MTGNRRNILCRKEEVWRKLCQKLYRRTNGRRIPETLDIWLYKPEGKAEIEIFVQQSKEIGKNLIVIRNCLV